jgi:hypothetical protein
LDWGQGNHYGQVKIWLVKIQLFFSLYLFSLLNVFCTFVGILAIDVSRLDGPLPRDVDVVAQDEGQSRAGVRGVQINCKSDTKLVDK